MEPISAIGFGIAVVQARSILTTVRKRIENYRKGRGKFQTLGANVDRLDKHLAEVETLVRKFPGAVPADISVIFNETLAAVRDNLDSTNKTMEGLFSTAFAGSSSALGKFKSKAVRVLRATELSTEISAMETKVDRASNQLLHLTTTLSNALKTQELQEAVLPKLEKLVEPTNEVFRPRTSAPALDETVKLDFDANDAEGNPVTPEGILKQSVLSTDSSSTVTAATGVMKSAFGIVGMAGVGKTVALQGLAHDKEVRDRFPDGVFFMTLGKGATVETVLRELSKVLQITGASTIAAVVGKCTLLRDAIDHATAWFENRICLFLVDDIWPTSDCKTGFLADLRQLVRDSPDSRIAISTRNTTIAQCAGAVVKFGARDALGSTSMRIFMAHATRGLSGIPNVELGSKLSCSILKILSICSGLPIALAVTGSAVAFLSSTYGDFEGACESYGTRLEKKRSLLGDEDTLEGVSLNASILLSLEYLEVEFLKWKAKRSQVINCSIGELYTSLCVLENQAWVPVSVLGRLWRLEADSVTDVVNLFCGMSLASLQMRQDSSGCPKEAGIILHDLQLDFCQRQAEETKRSSDWHAQLLSGYLKTRYYTADEPEAQVIASFIPRPWWSKEVPEDGYIHVNLSRHLSCSGKSIELAALLLDGRWTEVRTRLGGIFALKSDFDTLDNFVLQRERGQEPLTDGVRRGFGQIFKAVQVSWGTLSKGLRIFLFNVCGRLASSRKSITLVDTYVESVDKYAPKPFLLPLSSFFPALDNPLIMDISLPDTCDCVVSSPCGRYIAAGAGCYIVVANSFSGETLKRLHGHTNDVQCVAFFPGSKKIVSASIDESVMVWDWESSESPMHVLKGHSHGVSGVAVSGDGGRIYSSSWDRTLRVWDTATGNQECVLPQGSIVNCVTVCEESQNIAIGLDGGTLKVLHSVTKEVLFEDTEAHEDDVSCVSFSPSGSFLATGSKDETIHVWNTRTWTRAHEPLKGHEVLVTRVACSADGKKIASSSNDFTIRLWDVATGNCIGISPAVHSSIAGVSFIGNGDRIVSGSWDGMIQVWDARLEAPSKEQIYGHSDWVQGVAISQNGLQVASASKDGTVRLWNAQTGEQVGVPIEGHSGIVNCVSFSPDGRGVVSGSDTGDNGCLRLWDTETHSQIGDPFEGHTSSIHSASFSSDGLRIISASWDKTVRIWNTATHEQIGEELRGHSQLVYFVSESVDGRHIVSRDRGRRTIVWNRANGTMLWKSKKGEGELELDSCGDESSSVKDTQADEDAFENEITDSEAEHVIRSCGHLTQHLWPETFPEYNADLYCDEESVYSISAVEKTVLADLYACDWKYHIESKVFAAGLHSGGVVICRLRTE